MSSVFTDIRAALEKHLADASIAEIAWENVSYDATTGTSFLKPLFTPTIRRPSVMGTSPQQRYDGLFRVLCHAEEGLGPRAAEALADSVINRFEATTDINYTGSETVRISVDYADRRLGFLDTPWYIIPVSIGWHTYN